MITTAGYLLSERLARANAFAAAGRRLTAAILDACIDPAQAIRLLLPLAGWFPPTLPGFGALQNIAQDVQDLAASNLRCAACTALARATVRYRPLSYQDAYSLRQTVCAAIGAEAQRCADAGRDASYQALRNLYAAVALDLAVRGATLPLLVEVTTLVSMPSLAEAWTLYQDTTREPQLVASADPPHPLFMPLSFDALAF
jgi:prophage DNA circulation protein